MNVVMLTGKIKEFSELKLYEDGRAYLKVILECGGILNDSHVLDDISVTILNDMAEEVIHDCKIGEELSIQGCIKTYCVEMNGETYYNYEIIADYVTSLSFVGNKSTGH